MVSLLASRGWSGPALKLLAHAKNLDPNKPAVMQIRHTEREDVTQEKLYQNGHDSMKLVSTNTGRQAAVDFGASLPNNRQYKMFHTSIDRTRETAESLHQGITCAGGEAAIAGRIPYEPFVDMKARQERAKRLLLKYGVNAFPDGGDNKLGIRNHTYKRV